MRDAAKGDVPTLFYPNWHDNMHGEHFDPSVGVVFSTLKPYFGPVPDHEAHFGEPDYEGLANGYLYSDYVAGRIPVGICVDADTLRIPPRIRQRGRLGTGVLHRTNALWQAERIVSGPLGRLAVREAGTVSAVDVRASGVRQVANVAGSTDTSYPGLVRQRQRVAARGVVAGSVRQVQNVSGLPATNHYANDPHPTTNVPTLGFGLGTAPLSIPAPLLPGTYNTITVSLACAMGQVPATVSASFGGSPFSGVASGLLPVVSYTLTLSTGAPNPDYYDVVLSLSAVVTTIGDNWLTIYDAQDGSGGSMSWAECTGPEVALDLSLAPTDPLWFSIDP